MSSSLSLILSLSLAWLINQTKLSQTQVFWLSHKLKLKHYSHKKKKKKKGSNTIFRLVTSLSQARVLDFSWRAKLEHALLDKAQFVYNPTKGHPKTKRPISTFKVIPNPYNVYQNFLLFFYKNSIFCVFVLRVTFFLAWGKL